MPKQIKATKITQKDVIKAHVVAAIEIKRMQKYPSLSEKLFGGEK